MAARDRADPAPAPRLMRRPFWRRALRALGLAIRPRPRVRIITVEPAPFLKETRR